MKFGKVYMFFTLVILAAPISGLRPIDNRVYWTERRNLKWSDFWGAVPDHSPYCALSRLNILIESKWVHGEVIIKLHSYFEKEYSYVNVNCKEYYNLNHEQRHFDIMEVSSRATKKKLSESVINGECLKEEVDSIVQDVTSDIAVAWNEKYEAETDRGRYSFYQELWNERIDSALESLSAYADEGATLHFIKGTKPQPKILAIDK